MENMRTVFMHVYAFDILGIYIAAYVGTPVYHQTFPAGLICLMCKHSAEQSCSHYEIIVFTHPNPFNSSPDLQPSYFISPSLLIAENIARTDALVILELTPTP